MFNSLKIIFWILRAFSDTPYAIIGYNRRIKNTRVLFSVVICIGFFSLESIAQYQFFTSHTSLELKSTLLRIVKIIIVCACIIDNAIVELDRKNQFALALNYVNEFDKTAKFQGKKCKYKLNYCRVVMISTLICRTIAAYLTYKCRATVYTINYSYINGFLFFLYFIVQLQVFNFCGIILGLYQRFNYLNRFILTKGNFYNYKAGL